MENKLDGNVVGGILHAIFPFEMTSGGELRRVWSDGSDGRIGRVYARHGDDHPLPLCDTALIRVAEVKGRYWLDMRGVRVLQLNVEA